MTVLLEYFRDELNNDRLPQDSHGNFKVDFGKVDNPPRAGLDSIYTTLYVRNAHHYPMELRPVTLDKDLTITEYPEFLEPGQSGKVVLQFSPSADRIKPLEGGQWDFEKIVYSNPSS
jgi:hypothetical protein